MVVRVQSPALTPEGLMQLQDEFTDRSIAVRELMAGTFQKQIDQLNALKADIVAQQGIVDTAKKAAAVKVEADAYAVATRAKADQTNKIASGMLTEAEAKMQEALDKEKSVENREERAIAMAADADQREKDIDARINAAEDDMAQREKALAQGRAEVDAARAELARRKAVLDQQLQALQNIAA